MTNNRSDKLIEELVLKLRPVSPLYPPKVRTLFWLTANILTILVYFYIIGPVTKLVMDRFDSTFLMEFSFFIFCLATISYSSFKSVVPGQIKDTKLKYSLLPFIIFTIYLIFSVYRQDQIMDKMGHRPFCNLEVFFLAIIPISSLFFLIKKGLPSSHIWPSFLATLGSALIPAILMQIACSSDPYHTLVYHLTPALLFTMLSSFIFYKFILKYS